MCLIIAAEANAPKETKEMLLSVFQSNEHGIGIVHASEGVLIGKKWVITDKEKDINKFEEFYEYYSNISNENPCLIHFRKSTAGQLIEDNLHPFMVHDNLCFALNGTVSSLVFKDSDKSDTFVLNDIIIKKLHNLIGDEFYSEPVVLRLLTNYIGVARLVFFDNNGDFVFINKEKGFLNEEENIWYSNDLWKKKIEIFQRKEKYKRDHNTNHPVCNTSLVDFNSKKKNENYYLVGDKYYIPLSLAQIEKLKQDYKTGKTKQLKKRGFIAQLKHVPDKERLEGWLLYQKDHEPSIFCPKKPMVLNNLQQIPLLLENCKINTFKIGDKVTYRSDSRQVKILTISEIENGQVYFDEVDWSYEIGDIKLADNT